MRKLFTYITCQIKCAFDKLLESSNEKYFKFNSQTLEVIFIQFHALLLKAHKNNAKLY